MELAPALGRTRLADVEDAPFILDMINDAMSHTFRISNYREVIYLIENSVLSICQLNIENQIVGFMSLREYPLTPCVHPGAWEEYIWTKYKTLDLKPRNTLFVHLLCWKDPYLRELVDTMLRTVFMHDQYLQYICMYKSDMEHPLLKPGLGRAEASFRAVLAVERSVAASRLPTLYVCDRKEIKPRLRIRRAVEADNDDIVPIVEQHSERLRQLYGDFYVSEIIAHSDCDRILLVCEHNEVAVGVMCLNTEINFEQLEECYDLSPYAGLRRVLECHKLIDDIGSAGSFAEPCLKHGLDSASAINIEYLSREKESRTQGLDEDTDEDGFINETSYQKSAQAVDSHVFMFDLLNDEEEVEFDIINIDTSLILPELMLQEHIYDEKPKDHRKLRDKNWMKEKKLSSIAIIPKPADPPRRYTGPSNAFLLELFAMRADYDERIGFDMLEAAFELFPDRDYCITSIPSCQSTFPLLEHFVYCTSIGSSLKFIKESLYVAHINSVRGAVRVRLGEPADTDSIREVLEHAPKREAIMDLFQTSLRSICLTPLVLLAQDQPIGIIITKPLEEGTSIRNHYDLQAEPQRPGTDATIVAGVMSPALEVHSRWYMREVMRLTRFSTLFWSCTPDLCQASRNVISFVERMVPIRPRQAIPNITGNTEIDKLFKDASKPYSLWAIHRPLTALPKVNVNNNIVVVGASRTGLAFLEYLMMGPSSKYLTFTNLTLVSEQGLPIASDYLKAAATCVLRDGRYTERYIKSVPFYFYVDLIVAVMVKIDRKKKCIYFKGGGVKYYDQLVITCGEQFQHPEYLRESLELVTELKKGKPCERILMDNPKYQPDRVPSLPELPINVMLINTLYQANICLKKLLRMVADDTERCQPSKEKPIVVYGECIEAYSCIAALLELGIKPPSILFVEPFPPEDSTALRVNCFNDEKIDEQVQFKLESLGIHVLRKTHLVNWQLSNSRVTYLRFMSHLKIIMQPCFALFYYALKAMDLNAFKAINECGLVYDGGLIVSPTFETNDPAIYGAGTCVRYSRRLYATHQQQRYYNSEDIGESLGQLFLEKFDPFLVCNTECGSAIGDMLSCGDNPTMSELPKTAEGPRGVNNSNLSRRWQPVMKFDSPIMIVATLPGPMHYMKLQKPTPDIPMEVQRSLPHQGHTLVTEFKDSYFRVHLNVLHVVDAVTCMSRKPFSADLISQLYGKHEAFFNQLLLRFQLGKIEDLFKYFTQPWLSALYHETFDELLTSIDRQDVSSIRYLLKSEYSFTADKLRKSVANLKSQHTSCLADSTPECSDDLTITTFRSLLTKYIASHPLMQFKEPPSDIPAECGQNATVRRDVSKFWDLVEGERIVHAHVAHHVTQNSISNPHVAAPAPGIFYDS